MLIVRISEETCVNGDLHLFPDEICQDPAILFHGTSARNSELIDNEGLIAPKFPINDINGVLNLFEELEWYGINGHYATLFHYGRDAATRPIYLTEVCKQALGYSHNVCEMESSLGGCIIELEEFFEKPALREENSRRIQKKNLVS